jgi:hypothetical protein
VLLHSRVICSSLSVSGCTKWGGNILLYRRRPKDDRVWKDVLGDEGSFSFLKIGSAFYILKDEYSVNAVSFPPNFVCCLSDVSVTWWTLQIFKFVFFLTFCVPLTWGLLDLSDREPFSGSFKSNDFFLNSESCVVRLWMQLLPRDLAS